MSSNPKNGATLHAEAPHALYRVAIVGAGSLKGKEVAQILDERNFPSSDVKLLDDDESLGQLEALKDEITFIQSVRSEQFEHVDITFFADDAECTRRNWKQVQNAGSAIVDLSYALEKEPSAVLRAPWVERQLGRTITPDLQPHPAVIAQPVAIALAMLLTRIHSAVPIRHAAAVVFEPASEHGQPGMDELHQQTVNLLSFQELPKKVFDVQVAFNMVAQYGQESASKLAGVRDRILRHYAEISAARAPLPSLLVLQAPTFHAHSLAVNLQFENGVAAGQIASALNGEHVVVNDPDAEAPNNVNAAGQSDILVSILPDSDRSVWLWAAADNLRVAASSAVECAEGIAASRPRGQIQ